MCKKIRVQLVNWSGQLFLCHVTKHLMKFSSTYNTNNIFLGRGLSLNCPQAHHLQFPLFSLGFSSSVFFGVFCFFPVSCAILGSERDNLESGCGEWLANGIFLVKLFFRWVMPVNWPTFHQGRLFCTYFLVFFILYFSRHICVCVW